MKRFVSFFILSLFLIGCGSGSVSVKKNPFTNTVEISYDRWHKVQEGFFDNRRALYEREIKNGRKSPVKVTLEFAPFMGFSFDPTAGVTRLDQTLYLAIDDKSFKLKFVGLEVVKEVIPTGGGQTVDTGRYFYQKATFYIDPKVEKAILNCKSYMIQVTAGGKKTILVATPGQLSNVKKFLQAGAE